VPLLVWNKAWADDWSTKLKSKSYTDRLIYINLPTQKYRCLRGDVHTHTRLTALFLGLPGWAGTRKVKPIWILLKQEIVSGSGISWAIFKSTPRSRQITMPAPHHSVFLQAGCPFCRPTNQPHQSTEGRGWCNWSLLITHSIYDTTVSPDRPFNKGANIRSNNYKLQYHSFHYDLRKHFFPACIVNIWNTLPNSVVVNAFKARLDKFWQHQLVKFDFTADLTVYRKTIRRSRKVILFIFDSIY